MNKLASVSKKSENRTIIQPLFKWAGSKQRMLSQYEPYFFPKQPITRFVDLFAGGLTMTLWVAERYPDAEFVINDNNVELVELYKVLAKHEKAVIAEWQKCVNAWLPLDKEGRKAFYYDLREEYCINYKQASSIRLAAILLFMLQVNFNGMWKAYIKCNLRYSTPPGTCTQNAGFFDVSKIEKVAAILRKTAIYDIDFGDVPLQDGDFIYADPPYRDSIVDYQGGFTEDDQIRLADYLTSHNGNFAYSNKDIGDGWYAKHFPGTNIIDLSAKYTAGRGVSTIDVKEVLITNFTPIKK